MQPDSALRSRLVAFILEMEAVQEAMDNRGEDQPRRHRQRAGDVGNCAGVAPPSAFVTPRERALGERGWRR